jgi:NAD(P)-dependent dehydrogenase (short-subunit alcohol dehydrogenase family)
MLQLESMARAITFDEMARFVVADGSRGLGLAICRMLAARGDGVIACCKRPSAELLALGVRIEAGIDTLRADTLADLALRLRDISLDGVIHVASPAAGPSIEQQFALLTLGPWRLARALTGHLCPDARILLVEQASTSITRALSELAALLVRQELPEHDVRVVPSSAPVQPNLAADTETPIT